jgi:hypothetical protein
MSSSRWIPAAVAALIALGCVPASALIGHKSATRNTLAHNAISLTPLVHNALAPIAITHSTVGRGAVDDDARAVESSALGGLNRVPVEAAPPPRTPSAPAEWVDNIVTPY